MNTRKFLCLCDNYFKNARVTLKNPELLHVEDGNTKLTIDLVSESYLNKAYTFKT